MPLRLRLIHALAISSSMLAASIATLPTASYADDQALQYVQATHISVPTLPGGIPTKPGFNPAQVMAQQLQAQLQDRVHDFLTGVIRSALTHASPIIGMLADAFVTKLENNVMQRVMPTVVLKDKVVTSMTTISAQRTRVDYEHITIIAQCDEGKLLTLNHDAKTYFVTTLDSSDALIQAAVMQNTAATQVHIDRERDDQVETIAGMQAHHEIETLSAPGLPSATQDKWYAVSDMTNGCSQSGQTMAGNIEIPLRVERKVDVSSLPFQLPTMPGFDISKMLNTRIETTSVNKIAYDPAFFDVPAGYTRVAPPTAQAGAGAQGSPSPQPSPSTSPSQRVQGMQNRSYALLGEAPPTAYEGKLIECSCQAHYTSSYEGPVLVVADPAKVRLKSNFGVTLVLGLTLPRDDFYVRCGREAGTHSDPVGLSGIFMHAHRAELYISRTGLIAGVTFTISDWEQGSGDVLARKVYDRDFSCNDSPGQPCVAHEHTVLELRRLTSSSQQ